MSYCQLFANVADRSRSWFSGEGCAVIGSRPADREWQVQTLSRQGPEDEIPREELDPHTRRSMLAHCSHKFGESRRVADGEIQEIVDPRQVHFATSRLRRCSTALKDRPSGRQKANKRRDNRKSHQLREGKRQKAESLQRKARKGTLAAYPVATPGVELILELLGLPLPLLLSGIGFVRHG